MNRILLIILLNCFAQLAHAQDKYWIFLTDKAGGDRYTLSNTTLKNRELLGLSQQQESDKELSTHYLAMLKAKGVEPVCKSRWLNAVSACIKDELLEEVKGLPFVSKVVPLHKTLVMGVPADDLVPDYMSRALGQLQAESFLQEGLTGAGITIGVIDAGFLGADSDASLRHLFERRQIKGIRDYINPQKKEFFGQRETQLDFHGTTVLKNIAGFDTARMVQFGLARHADFYLARTDHGKREFRGEEDFWVAALEWMDSLGVRVINTSLGYALGFDDPAENYRPDQMDGQTSVIARAAQIAAEEKGILIVVSAGNDGGNRKWKVISTPADARGVLSVGATPGHARERISYSGVGPEFLPYLKPNVVCFSMTGTSFSAPVVAGMAACLLQKNPRLSNKQLIDIIEKSGHLYPYGNNFIGYGVPLSYRALAFAQDTAMLAYEGAFTDARERKVRGNSIQIPIEDPNLEWVVVFHKKNTAHVLEQQSLKPRRQRVIIKKPQGAVRSTVDLGNKVVELIWE